MARKFTLPDQTGYAGNSLFTNGENPYWAPSGSGGGVSIGSPVYGGTPTEVLYIDNSGNLYSDSLFTRDSSTNETFIGLTGTDLASNLQIAPIGNTLIWDADTTDDIQDIIAQSQNLAGIGVKGNGIAHIDTNTGETAGLFIGDLTALPGGRPFQAEISYSGPGATLNHSVKADDTGAAISHFDSVANTQGFITAFTSGNLAVWKADTTDTIITKLEQSQNIAGLGASGSALTWLDTGTQIAGITGVLDATAVGLYPGSVIMATNNLSTGASGSIATNYDNVLNIATVVANAGNGDFDSGFEFDDGRMVVRYRNNIVGLESSFEADANSAVTRYTADGTNEYQVVLGNGTFTLKNSTTGNEYMAIDLASGVYEIGDLDASGNDTKLIINDTNRIINLNAESALGYSFRVTASGASNYAQLFGTDNTDYTGIVRVGSSNTVMESQNSLLSTTNTVQTSSAAVVLSSTGSGGTSQQSLSANIFSIYNVGGDQMFNLNTATIVASIGDIDAIGNNTLLLVDDDNEQIEFTSRSITTNSRDIPITVKTTLTPSDVNGMNTTPVAPTITVPTGYAVQILDVYGSITYNTTPYATNTTINIAFSTAPTQSVWQNAILLTETSSIMRRFVKTSGSGADVVIPNDTLVITNTAGNPTAGDSNIDVYITYKLIQL